MKFNDWEYMEGIYRIEMSCNIEEYEKIAKTIGLQNVTILQKPKINERRQIKDMITKYFNIDFCGMEVDNSTVYIAVRDREEYNKVSEFLYKYELAFTLRKETIKDDGILYELRQFIITKKDFKKAIKCGIEGMIE